MFPDGGAFGSLLTCLGAELAVGQAAVTDERAEAQTEPGPCGFRMASDSPARGRKSATPAREAIWRAGRDIPGNEMEAWCTRRGIANVLSRCVLKVLYFAE